jgi:Calx-beta domain
MKYFKSFLVLATLILLCVIGCDNNPVDFIEPDPVIEEMPFIQFAISNSSDGEAINQVEIEVVLSKVYSKPVSATINIITEGSTATNGVDYTLSSGVIEISAGDSITVITLTIIDDEFNEGDETIIAVLSNPENATLGDNTWHTYVIQDDELTIRPDVQFSTTSSSGDESINTVNLGVDLSELSNKEVSVNYTLIGGTATANDTDFTCTNGTLTIPAGQSNAFIEIAIVDDDLGEGDETIIVILSTPINANLGDNTWHTYVIQDDELTIRPDVQFSTTSSSGDESIGTINLGVDLSEISNKDISVDYTLIGGTATANDTDFTCTNGTLTIPAGQSNVFIDIAIIDDELYEDDETFSIVLSNPINADLGENTWHTYSIIDNEELFAQLRLIPMSNAMAARAINGYIWLSPLELQTGYIELDEDDISFGEINATDELMFVLMNTGTVDVTNVQFTTANIDVTPGSIGVIRVTTAGSEISALPIVTLTKEHVIPMSGVGSLLDITVGDFTDTLNISYEYLSGATTIEISDDYSIAGTTMGAIIDMNLSGIPLEEYDYSAMFITYLTEYPHDMIALVSLPSSGMSTFFIQNNGNSPLQMQIANEYFGFEVILDTVLHAGINLDVSGIVRGSDFIQDSVDQGGNILIFGSTTNQPYIFTAAGYTWTEGVCGILIDEYAD